MLKKVNESVWKEINYEKSKFWDDKNSNSATHNEDNDSSNSNSYSSVDNSSLSSSDFGLYEEIDLSSK